MERTYQVVSADGHLEVPPDPWVRHVAPAYRDLAPRLLRLADGGEAWLVEGQPLVDVGANLSAGRPIRLKGLSYWNEDGTSVDGAGDAAQRLREQDRDGLDAEVLFPPIFATQALSGISDPRAYLAIVQGYNDYLASDYCPLAPDRLLAAGVIPASGIEDAISELRRCRSLGLSCIALHQFPNGGGGPKAEDDRFWEVALDLGMPVTAHTHFGERYPPALTGRPTAGDPSVGSLVSRQAFNSPIWTVMQLVCSGVFDRFPDLRIYFAETNASWMPCVLYQLDDNFGVYRERFGERLSKQPSEYVRDHVLFSMIRDPHALRMLELLPVDNLMWGSDFPHSVSSWPSSRSYLAEAFADVPEPIRRRILVETPCAFFGLDPTKPITATPG